jgi:hypothetical protein
VLLKKTPLVKGIMLLCIMFPNFRISAGFFQETFWAQHFMALLVTNKKNMGNILYFIAMILLIGWLIGFLGYAAGGLIHILLVLAVISVLLNFIGGRDRKI